MEQWKEGMDSLDHPVELEKFYRRNRKAFLIWFETALGENPGSETLRVWAARLNYAEKPAKEGVVAGILKILVLSLVALGLVKVPLFTSIDAGFYYPRFVPIILFGALILYFFRRGLGIRHHAYLLMGILLSAFVMIWWPNVRASDSIIMSQIYMPFVMLSLLGISFAGDRWLQSEARIEFIRYLGELFIYSVLILLGGMVLTGLTFGLFRLIGVSIEGFYLEFVVVWGLLAAPFVATFLYDTVLGRESKLAGLISNVFSPLFLVTVIAYLVTIAFQGKSPYSDRDFLITFNGLLVVVWGITVFSAINHPRGGKSGKVLETMNAALLGTTLVINAVALSAIVFRLSEYGVTPNRISVAGANILMFFHMILMLRPSVVRLKTGGSNEAFKKCIADYLPVYSAWSLFVAVFFPILFQYR